MERGCCGDRHCWMPEAILVPNGESTIDIAPTLVDNHDKYASLRTRQESLRVFFFPRIDTLQSALDWQSSALESPLSRLG